MSQSLPNQVNDFNNVMSVDLGDEQVLSQSLPNQVNDFNHLTGWSFGQSPTRRNPFQTRSTTSIFGTDEGDKLLRQMSQSLPNQVNDFNL